MKSLCKRHLTEREIREIGAHEFDVPFATSQQMADFLAITRTALSLAVKRLVARGVIAHPAHSRFVIR